MTAIAAVNMSLTTRERGFPGGERRDHLEGADDEELFRLAREHVDRDHPEMQRSEKQIRQRVANDAADQV